MQIDQTSKSGRDEEGVVMKTNEGMYVGRKRPIQDTEFPCKNPPTPGGMKKKQMTPKSLRGV